MCIAQLIAVNKPAGLGIVNTNNLAAYRTNSREKAEFASPEVLLFKSKIKPIDKMQASNVERLVFQQSNNKTKNDLELKGKKMVQNDKDRLQVIGEQSSGVLSQYQSGLSQAKA